MGYVIDTFLFDYLGPFDDFHVKDRNFIYSIFFNSTSEFARSSGVVPNEWNDLTTWNNKQVWSHSLPGVWGFGNADGLSALAHLGLTGKPVNGNGNGKGIQLLNDT